VVLAMFKHECFESKHLVDNDGGLSERFCELIVVTSAIFSACSSTGTTQKKTTVLC